MANCKAGPFQLTLAMLVWSALSIVTSQTWEVQECLALAEHSESWIILKLFRFIIESVRQCYMREESKG